MERDDERRLTRLLAGELDAGEARRLRRRLAEEPELAAAWVRLQGAWRSLAPRPVPLPPGFAGRVMAQVRDEAGDGARRASPRFALWRAPLAARAAGAAALVAGLGLGAALGAGLASAPGVAPDVAPAAGADLGDYADYYAANDAGSLAEDYVDALASFAETNGRTNVQAGTGEGS